MRSEDRSYFDNLDTINPSGTGAGGSGGDGSVGGRTEGGSTSGSGEDISGGGSYFDRLDTIDTSSDSIGGGPYATSGRRRRSDAGQKRGPRRGKVDIDGITSAIYSIHIMLAFSINVPELQLTEEESKALAAAIVNAKQHFPFLDQAISQKYIDIGTLIAVLGKTYIPRFFMYRSRTATLVQPEVEQEYPMAAE